MKKSTIKSIWNHRSSSTLLMGLRLFFHVLTVFMTVGICFIRSNVRDSNQLYCCTTSFSHEDLSLRPPSRLPLANSPHHSVVFPPHPLTTPSSSIERKLWPQSMVTLNFFAPPLSVLFGSFCCPLAVAMIQDTYDDRELEKALKGFVGVSSEAYRSMVEPGCRLSKQIGNTYTASVFANIVCLVDAHGAGLEGQTALVFSYGSG